MSAAAATTRTFYKMDVQGIVYLVDPATTIAYTYDLTDPTPVGTIHWTDISSPPRIVLYDDARDRLDEKMKAHATASAAPAPAPSTDE
jgi:hypothetical protein